MTAPKQYLKSMVITSISFDHLISMERELIWYTDSLLVYAARQGGSLGAAEKDLGRKLDLWAQIASIADLHHRLHIQILGTIDALKKMEDPDPKDAPVNTLTIPMHLFEVITSAFNSPFLNLKDKAHKSSFWYRLAESEAAGEGDPSDTVTYLRHHAEVVNILRQATSVTTEAEDEEDEEDEVLAPLDTSFFAATMPSPRGEQ
jgi:hypothetical protein